jgi:hypothetical protein
MIRTVKTENKLSSKLTFKSRVYQQISRFLVQKIPYIPSPEQYNITLCHSKSFLWFRVAKAGTRTIFDVFDKANIELDAEHPFNCHYPPNLYRDYFKFAFVRNPWDRLVSCWCNKVLDKNYFGFKRDELLKMKKFENFVNFVAQQNIEKCDIHIRLQSKLIDTNEVDYVGRFENFEEDLLKIIQTIGLGAVEIEKHNASSNRLPYRDYYNKDLREKVAKIYSRDINQFSYKF